MRLIKFRAWYKKIKRSFRIYVSNSNAVFTFSKSPRKENEIDWYISLGRLRILHSKNGVFSQVFGKLKI